MDKFHVREDQIMKDISYHNQEVDKLKKELDEITRSKYIYCKEIFNHDWVVEKETCLYGMTFTVCKICGYEK